MGRIARFLSGYLGEDDGAPGLFEKLDRTVWYRTPAGDENEISSGGSQPVLAVVAFLGFLNPWDGTALPFDTVRYDPDSLWDGVNHWFAAKIAGWYRLTLYSVTSSGGIVSSGGGGAMTLQIGGAGDNIGTPLPPDTSVSGMTGYTHLGIGDTVELDAAGVTLGVSSVALALELAEAT